MGRFRNREAGRLNCYKGTKLSRKNPCQSCQEKILAKAVKKKYLTADFFYSKLPFVARNMPCFRQKGQTVMEKIVEQGLLYDFYGELLTEHQKNIYEDAVYNDMSLAEIAE